MKRVLSALALLALCLALSGCARGGSAAVWSFECEQHRYADDFYASDGALLSWCSYSLPRLRLSCEGGSGAEPPEGMAAAKEAFNAEAEHRLSLLEEEYRELEQLAVGRYAVEGEEGFRPCFQSLELTETRLTERLLCVRCEGLKDWGGERPLPCAAALCFDLKNGRFVTWRELTEDAEGLRSAMARELEAQLSEREGFYPDAAERAAGAFWDAEVYFADDGAHLIFPAYLLAPYSSELPELTVSYEALRPFLNEYGKELLG